jgi:hypothetical protein
VRTTVDLPDELFRKAKAEAALRGIKFKDLIEAALSQALESPNSRGSGARRTKRPTLHDLMKDSCGIVDSGVSDLATDPKHMEGFGRDSIGNR